MPVYSLFRESNVTCTMRLGATLFPLTGVEETSVRPERTAPRVRPVGESIARTFCASGVVFGGCSLNGPSSERPPIGNGMGF